VKEISVTSDHVCALKTDMTVWCWGDNSNGQLGIGDTSLQRALYPVRVTALSNGVSDVVTTWRATCATSSDGNAWCWGASWALGMQPTLGGASSYVPVRVLTGATTPLSQVGKIVDMNAFGSSAYFTMCALKTDRTLWCWGSVNAPGVSYAHQLVDYDGVPVANVGITGRGCYLDAYGHKWQSVPGPSPVLMTTRELPNYVPVPCP
jgi:alpha-tubulin suppressor-like RCC1 family protein